MLTLKYLKNHIHELVVQGVIDAQVGHRLTIHYANQEHKSSHRILMTFGVLAACLIGLGIILIIAHNWDYLGRGIKTSLAFLPLLVSQGLVFCALKYKPQSEVWKESCSVLLFFGIGACMAMVSQIYNLQGELSHFLLTWMLLSLPIFYLVSSRVVAIFYFIGVSLAIPSLFSSIPDWSVALLPSPWPFLITFTLGLPYYIYQLRKSKFKNSTSLMNWTVALSFLTIIIKNEFSTPENIAFMFIMLMGIYLGIGRLSYFKNKKLRINSFSILGSVGTFFILYLSSFEDFWEYVIKHFSPGIVKIVILSGSGLALLIWNIIKKNLSSKALLPYVFIVYILITSYTNFSNSYLFGVLIINLLLLAIGIEYILKGHKTNRLTFYNYGLAIISITAITRFLEWNLSFVGKGICFVALGILFFGTNYFLVKRKKYANRLN